MPKSEISFETDGENALTITIQTQRLTLSSVKEVDLEPYYSELFSDQEVMKKYGEGTPLTEDVVSNMVKTWTKRWEMNDPFSSFTVRESQTDEFAGQVILGHGKQPGTAELAGASPQRFWARGFGFEAAKSIVTEYAPKLVKKKYQIDGQPLTAVVATARPDNEASVKILQKLDMTFEEEREQYNGRRKFYRKTIK